MNGRNLYQVDEEQASGGGLAVSPLWPLLALMLAGAWCAWAWFIYNAYALKSPTFRREVIWSAAGIVGSLLLALVILAWAEVGNSEEAMIRRLRYALIGLSVWKLVIGYRVYLLQSRTVELYEFYGGQLRNPFIVLIGLFLVRGTFIGMIHVPFVAMALS